MEGRASEGLARCRAEKAEDHVEALRSLLVTHWHESAYTGSLALWMGMTDEEYAAWVEQLQPPGDEK